MEVTFHQYIRYCLKTGAIMSSAQWDIDDPDYTLRTCFNQKLVDLSTLFISDLACVSCGDGKYTDVAELMIYILCEMIPFQREMYPVLHTF